MLSEYDTKFDGTIYKEPYFTCEGCLFEAVEKKGERLMVKLCDYIPLLRSEITYDDGTDRRKVFEVSAEHASGVTLPTVRVTAEDMTNMKWLLEQWGALGSYSPKGNTVSKIRHAITLTSGEIDFKTIYSQTGWREIGGEWFFLMPQADSPLTVELKGKLAAYHFNSACADDYLIYLTAMLEDSFLPQRVILPLLAVAFVSPLEHFLRLAGCEPKFITALVGKTGTRKSTTAALFCSFFGDFNASSLPNSFHDTSNSILSNVYYTKDVLTCVDDLHPNGFYGNAEMRNTAQNLSKYYGDRTGRDWICDDVLPSIRKYGYYITPKLRAECGNDPEKIKAKLHQIALQQFVDYCKEHPDEAVDMIMKLKNEMGFKGFIVSDWGSVQNITGLSYKEQVIKSVNAGIDMLMETDKFAEAKQIIVDAVGSGDISEERISNSKSRCQRK